LQDEENKKSVRHNHIWTQNLKYFHAKNLHLGHRLNALGAGFYFSAADFFSLKIDFEFSFGGNVGMASGISGPGSPPANLTNSRHSNVPAVPDVPSLRLLKLLNAFNYI